jgi:hypothetical protein
MVASRPDQSPSKPEAESTSRVVDPVKGSMTDVVVESTVDRSGSVTGESAEVVVVVVEDDVDGVDEFNVVVTGWRSSPLEMIV